MTPATRPGEAATAPSVVVGDSTAVDGDDATKVMPLEDHTAVMPAILQPVPVPDAAPPDRRGVWAVVALVALIAVLVFAQAGGGIDVPTPTTSDPVSVTSQPPSTTSPPTTAEPAAEGPGKGKGRDRGRD